MKNPVLFIVFFIFSIANIVDIITAFFILPGEANPIYLLTGNIYIILIAKIAFISILYYYYHRNIYPSNFMYYLIVMILVLGSMVTGLAVYANISGILNPKIVEQAVQMSTEEKVVNYVVFSAVFYIIPVVFCLLTFIIYDKTYKYIKVDKEFFKKRRWWKLWKGKQ